MSVLSIQSHVAYGHVGNSASVFPMQRLGVEVWPVNTVNFSNHTGYGAWRGPLMDPADVADVITGIGEREAFAEVDAVLSGYQGGEGIGATILDAVAAVKAANAILGPSQRISGWRLWPESDFPRTHTLKVKRDLVRAWASANPI